MISAAVVALVFNCPIFQSCISKRAMEKNNQGWVSLFDGKTTDGWHTYGSTVVKGAWEVDEGVLHLDASRKRKGEKYDLVTNKEFGNFNLKLEWKISLKGNSGIIFYVHDDPAQYKHTHNTGLEMQVLDNERHPDAKIH